ncbi:TetR/AcrR family transcriptional regulator [Ancylobacter pratisalsi]|uniref:Helix-turn-helix transcriptional regulator n=1 Tax=Ancylobacter pratisalsi TaxID=1745854 RepID=A0A6P1YQW7_9HYPH|nr:TetR/AcrR family transcriptional regulator [Ancylobacter pratisalsi]QIB35086.1 helix-turn-helix transcriptional regulator [Ancylobacter pratisalsi]
MSGRAAQERAGREKTTAPRCPSRRTERGTAACAELRRVAAEMFLAHGYDGTHLDAILAEVGGSKTNIYAFFGGKEGLFEAAIAHACADILAPLEEVALDGLSLEDGLTRLGRAMLDLVLTPRSVALYRLAIGCSARFPRLGAVWFASGPAVSQAVVARFVADRLHAAALPGAAPPSAHASPDLSPDHTDPSGRDPALLARLFHDMTVQELLYRALFEPAAGEDARTTAARLAARAVVALFVTRNIRADQESI